MYLCWKVQRLRTSYKKYGHYKVKFKLDEGYKITLIRKLFFLPGSSNDEIPSNKLSIGQTTNTDTVLESHSPSSASIRAGFFLLILVLWFLHPYLDSIQAWVQILIGLIHDLVYNLVVRLLLLEWEGFFKWQNEPISIFLGTWIVIKYYYTDGKKDSSVLSVKGGPHIQPFIMFLRAKCQGVNAQCL